MAKKRTNGEGTIRQRETGLWECTIMDGFQPNGKRKYKSFYGNTQGEVKKKMKAPSSEMCLGSRASSSCPRMPVPSIRRMLHPI